MPCFTPLKAWCSITQRRPATGKRIISFRPIEFVGGTEKLQVPCSSCDGCRLARSRQWAIRCWHEASLYQNNCFITLTFDNEHLDPEGSLQKADFQKFMKRLRKHFYGNTKGNVRYMHCAEYGEKFARPHHHALLFNFDFPDKELKRKTPAGCYVYTSVILSKLWPQGIHEIGQVTYKSSAYVARYILKKRSKKQNAYAHYKTKEPEYITMSRRPGIASEWFDQYKSDVYPHDSVALEGGYKVPPPKYYDRKYELTNPEDHAILKKLRVERAKADPNNTPDRLSARHEILKRQLTRLKRGYENET